MVNTISPIYPFERSFDAASMPSIPGIFTTNLVYQSPNLLSKPYYYNVEMSKYVALIIDNLNHDSTISGLLTPTNRINNLLEKVKNNK